MSVAKASWFRHPLFASVLAMVGSTVTGAQDQRHFDDQSIVECLALQGVDARSVAKVSNLPGLYEVDAGGGDYLYVMQDCRHLVAGNLYEIRSDHQLVALTERARSAKRREIIAAIPQSEMLVLEPPETKRTSVVVFTDVGCVYCRAFHQQIAEYQMLGIEIRYVAYPSPGLGSSAFQAMVSAWCSDDPLSAITTLKKGDTIPPMDCANPVASHFRAGQEIGIEGTPTMILPSGRMLSGYFSPAQLAEALGLD
ncbi:MAG: DsbC family protein [Gammaproteobacteria bacterium]|nr:DsbC family protein [Gammaproteobacteria bacterium]MYK44919.1 DsbC family protein [Gammaproteobacteria bacterium]